MPDKRATNRARPALRWRDADARLAAILMVLLSSGHANGEELAARFGVAPRTIYRDIESLKRRGVPIESSVGPGGGYLLQPRADEFSPPSTSDAGLASLLTDSGPFAAIGRPNEEVMAILDRAESALDEGERQALDRVRARIYFDTEEWYVRDISEPHFDSLRDAVLNDNEVLLHFRDRTGTRFEEAVHPIGLVWKGGFWYLFVRRPNKAYERVRLERIEQVAPTGKRFRRPRRPLVDLWRDELAQFGIGATTVRLVITGSAIREFEHFNWKEENRITKHDGRWDVEMHVDSYDWLIPIALSYAGGVEILEPGELRVRVAEAALQVAVRHGASDTAPSAAAGNADLGEKGDVRGRAIRGRES